MQHRYFIAYKTIVTKEFSRFLRIWMQTILPPVITMTLYFVIFGSLIGPRIGTMGGFNYIEYIAPGLIMMSVITHSYSNVVSSFFSAKFQKNIEEMLVAPVPEIIILAGYVTGGLGRGLIVGIVVTIVALFFTRLQVSHPLIMIYAVVMTSILFALGGFINAIFARNFDDISIIPSFVLTPLTYLGGIFYSIELLSPAWRTISLGNPVLYMVNAFRYGVLGVSDISVVVALAVITGFTIFLFCLSLFLLKKGIGIKA